MELHSTILSTALLLLLVIDPFGNVPILLSILKDTPKSRHYKIIIREMVIGLIILFGFLFFGHSFLNLFHLQTEAVTIAGGIILFVIGIRLIFPAPHGQSLYGDSGEPFVVPIAMPMIAGPSTLATLLVMTQSTDHGMTHLTLALLLAWVITAIVLLSSPLLYKLLKEKGLQAMERLMGMLLLIMAVQMFINGVTSLIKNMAI